MKELIGDLLFDHISKKYIINIGFGELTTQPIVLPESVCKVIERSIKEATLTYEDSHEI